MILNPYYRLLHYFAETRCRDPPPIEFGERVMVFRRISSDETQSVLEAPYKYNDMAVYKCKPGYERESNVAFHYCDSRKVWTGRTICKRMCI